MRFRSVVRGWVVSGLLLSLLIGRAVRRSWSAKNNGRRRKPVS